VPNDCSEGYARGLVDATNSIVQDVWASVSQHNNSKTPMPPTAIFKCKSLAMLAALAELFSMMIPQQIGISVVKVLQQS